MLSEVDLEADTDLASASDSFLAFLSCSSPIFFSMSARFEYKAASFCWI